MPLRRQCRPEGEKSETCGRFRFILVDGWLARLTSHLDQAVDVVSCGRTGGEDAGDLGFGELHV
jgi:hypothetical protein